MNHGFKMYPDGTLEITVPKGTKVGRVLVCEARTQNGGLYYRDTDDDEYISRSDALDILDQFEDAIENGEAGFYSQAREMMANLPPHGRS